MVMKQLAMGTVFNLGVIINLKKLINISDRNRIFYKVMKTGTGPETWNLKVQTGKKFQT